jgi:hypothetical protein
MRRLRSGIFRGYPSVVDACPVTVETAAQSGRSGGGSVIPSIALMSRRSGPPLPCLERDVPSAQHKRQEGGPVMVYLGVDLHRKRSHVMALGEGIELPAH